MNSSTSSLKRIQAANIDGRARSPGFIQGQLKGLHDSLVENLRDLCQGIQTDTSHSHSEIAIEYFLALNDIKEHYKEINFEDLLAEEYLVANGKASPFRRTAAGIVYITPTSHTLLYSVIAPLSAAIAAGNCVILEVSLYDMSRVFTETELYQARTNPRQSPVSLAPNSFKSPRCRYFHSHREAA